MLRTLIQSLVLAPLLLACAPMPGPTPPPATGPVADAGIGLREGVCFGTCPAYEITVYPNEFYELNLMQFTRAPGTTETGTFPTGTFAAANAALQTANFTTLPTDITQNNPVDCPPPIVSDLPPATISETTIAGTRTVNYYPGCFGAPTRTTLNMLLADLRTAFGIPALVEP